MNIFYLLQANATENLPRFLCNGCVMQLGVALNFKEQCIRSENQLREVLLHNDQNKVIVEDIEDNDQQIENYSELNYSDKSNDLELCLKDEEVCYNSILL